MRTSFITKTIIIGTASLTMATQSFAADALDKIGLAEAHQITQGSDSVKIALLSTSVNCKLPAIKDSIDRVQGGEASFDACAPIEGTNSLDLDHGTYSASILHRIAPNVRIVPIRLVGAAGTGSDADILATIKLAILNNVNVIAFGAGGSGGPSLDATCALVESARLANITVVVPAGNSGTEITSEEPMLMSSCKNDALFSVAALNGELTNLTQYSNFSSYFVQLAAPGGQVAGLSSTGKEMMVNGTTVSFLVAAGAVALRRSVFPEESATSRRNALLNASDYLDSLVGKVESTGVINLERALK